jgi:hypothetical protein
MAIAANVDPGVKGMVGQIVDFDPFDTAAHLLDDIGEQIVCHGPGR